MANNFYSEWRPIEDYFGLLDKFNRNEISIFHSKEWLLSIKESFKLEIRSLISFKNNEICAITPFSFLKKGCFLLVGSPLKGTFTQIGGPIYNDKLNDLEKYKVITSIEEKLKRYSFYVEWSPNIEVKVNNFPIKYLFSEYRTLTIDISKGELALWNSFQSRARNMIRKAEKFGLKAEIRKPNKSWFKNFYELLRQVYKKQNKIPPHPLSFYFNLCSLKNNQICCIDVIHENDMIAAGIFIIDRKKLIFLSGASNIIGNKLSAPSLIQWSAMKYVLDKVYIYDMGGIGVSSIDRFKKSFGGRVYSSQKIIRTNFLYKFLEPIVIFIKKYFNIF